jgi:hypothetical protein
MKIKSGWRRRLRPSHDTKATNIIPAMLIILVSFISIATALNSVIDSDESLHLTDEELYQGLLGEATAPGNSLIFDKDVDFNFDNADIIDHEMDLANGGLVELNLTDEQAYLYNRITASKMLQNPYSELDMSQSNYQFGLLSLPFLFNFF